MQDDFYYIHFFRNLRRLTEVGYCGCMHLNVMFRFRCDMIRILKAF
jgi:hypothetical protein